MSAGLLWLQLAVAAAVILAASQFLARSADVIAEKTGLGRSLVGVVMLATATSLPELGTGVSSILLVDEPDLAAGDAFGSNVFNLLIIAVLDLFWRDGPILNAVGRTTLLIGWAGISAISLAVAAILVHGATGALSTWYLSPASVLMMLVFLGAMFMIYRHDTNELTSFENGAGSGNYESDSFSRAVATYSVAAGTVVVAAVWLARTGDSLADVMGWEASFVGTQFLALSTSLPELGTSLAAIRLNAPDLAISNVLGSNLFNMGFVLFVDDVAYTKGSLWTAVSQVHVLTGVAAVLMTSTVVTAMLLRGRRRLLGFWTAEGATLTGLYLAASVLVFYLA